MQAGHVLDARAASRCSAGGNGLRQLGFRADLSSKVSNFVQTRRRTIEWKGWIDDMDSVQSKSTTTPRYRDAHLELDFNCKLATLDAHHLLLTRKEYDVLSLLVENAGEIVPRGVILSRVWSYGDQIHTRTLDVHIRRLRNKLGAHSQQYLETIVGLGYRFQPYRTDRRFPTFAEMAPV
jgi:DNA-binding response OmpR family regulator